MTGNFFADAPVISAYTTEQAVADGVLMDARQGDIAEITREHFGSTTPVYLSAGLAALIQQAVDNPRWCNDWCGVLHDIYFMSRGTRPRGAFEPPVTRFFRVIITGTGRVRSHMLRVVYNVNERGQTTVTYLLENED